MEMEFLLGIPFVHKVLALLVDSVMIIHLRYFLSALVFFYDIKITIKIHVVILAYGKIFLPCTMNNF